MLFAGLFFRLNCKKLRQKCKLSAFCKILKEIKTYVATQGILNFQVSVSGWGKVTGRLEKTFTNFSNKGLEFQSYFEMVNL